MLTPQEAEAKVFLKASFGSGYNMQQVDAFLDELLANYRSLYQENANLKSKMKVLVDKVEEYRSTEDAMRRALHSAQQMAEDLVKEGEAQKQAAIDSAVEAVKQESALTRAEMEKEEQAVQARIEGVKTDLANEKARLEAARLSTIAYVEKLKSFYAKELEYIGSLSELTAEQLAAQAAAPAQGVQSEGTDPAQPQGGEKTGEPGTGETQTETPTPGQIHGGIPPEQQAAAAQDIEAAMTKIFEPAGTGDLGDTRVFDQVQFGKEHQEET